MCSIRQVLLEVRLRSAGHQSRQGKNIEKCFVSVDTGCFWVLHWLTAAKSETRKGLWGQTIRRLRKSQICQCWNCCWRGNERRKQRWSSKAKVSGLSCKGCFEGRTSQASWWKAVSRTRHRSWHWSLSISGSRHPQRTVSRRRSLYRMGACLGRWLVLVRWRHCNGCQKRGHHGFEGWRWLAHCIFESVQENRGH